MIYSSNFSTILSFGFFLNSNSRVVGQWSDPNCSGSIPALFVLDFKIGGTRK